MCFLNFDPAISRALYLSNAVSVSLMTMWREVGELNPSKDHKHSHESCSPPSFSLKYEQTHSISTNLFFFYWRHTSTILFSYKEGMYQV